MDGIHFTYPRRGATVVEQLMRSNDVAPEYLLPAIRNGLATLETLLAQRNGKPTNLADDICLFKSILSSIRSIPEEVWQQVFVHLIDRYDSRTLSSLCGVSRKWCSAARSETQLWRYLPPLIVGPAGGSQAAIIENRLDTFIRRAGSLPLHVDIIDPSYTHNPASWSHYRPALSLLINQPQRWSSARIIGTVSTLNELQSIQGNLPELTKLRIELHGDHSMAHPSPVFADAPRLRHVILIGHGRQFISFDLPWSRLETVQSSISGEDDETYRYLMDAPPGVSSLKSLDMTSNQPSCTFPPQPNTLPSLQILRLSLLGVEPAWRNVVNHFALLTLPALVVLEAFKARATTTYAVSRAILDIVKRSGCSLQRLSLDMPLNGMDAKSLEDVMRLSPALTHLHLHTFEIPAGPAGQQMFRSVIQIREGLLSMLVFDHGDTRLLPALEVLRIDSTFTSPNFSFDLLRNIIHSRSNLNLSAPKGSTGHHQLKELQLYSYNMIKSTESLHKLSQIQASFQLEAPSPNARPNLPAEMVSRWRERIIQDLRQSWAGGQYLRGDIYQLLGMDIIIREMETFDLKEYDTRALAEKGIIPLLHKISASYPDISTYRFSSRARKLCEAWKPYVLRDIGCLPYYWVYFCDGVILKNVHLSEPGKDELLWKDTLGYAGNGIETYAKPVHLDTLTLKNHEKLEMCN